MEITPTLAADLARLNETFDDPDIDIAESLRQLAIQAKLAVESYLGLAVAISSEGNRLTFTFAEGTLADESAPSEAALASLMISFASHEQYAADGLAEKSPIDASARPSVFDPTGLGSAVDSEPDGPATSFAEDTPIITLILFAGTAGAFVDLAADISWLTGRGLHEFALDQHLPLWHETLATSSSLPTGSAMATGSLGAISDINQAIGVLIERGHTLEQAHVALAARAASTGADRSAAAADILAEFGVPDPDVD